RRPLQSLYDLICTRAHQAALDGDPDHLGARKAKALTSLTDLTGTEPAPDKVRLYFHVNAADLDHEAIGQVERLGPATLTKLKDWIATRRVTVLPVLDTGRTDAVDTHDPPLWIRELVILRDQHCVFPGCQIDARSCDLDHVTTYDPHGPPGQTCPDNLAALCRRHHRAKTTGLWRYNRTPDGSYECRGPHGLCVVVVPQSK
ncbi:MAG: HNH endonuclease signature motif containing protein, partial [Nocardioides sp.]